MLLVNQVHLSVSQSVCLSVCTRIGKLLIINQSNLVRICVIGIFATRDFVTFFNKKTANNWKTIGQILTQFYIDLICILIVLTPYQMNKRWHI